MFALTLNDVTDIGSTENWYGINVVNPHQPGPHMDIMSNSTSYLMYKQKAFITVKYVEMTYICYNLCYDINFILHADIYNCLKTSVL
jgi:hypothetical protein